MKMSLASPLQLSSMTDHSCANGVKEKVVAEGTSGDQPQGVEDGGPVSEVERVTIASTTSTQVRRVQWSKEEPLALRSPGPDQPEEEVGDEAQDGDDEKVSHAGEGEMPGMCVCLSS